MFRTTASPAGKADGVTVVKNDVRKFQAVDVAIDGNYDDLMSQRGGLTDAYSITTSIDELTKQGVYYTTVENFPNESKLIVLNSKDGSNPVQMLFNSGKHYLRHKENNAWTSWSEIVDNESSQTITGAKTFTDDITVQGDVVCTGAVLTASDKRLKENITPISLDKIDFLKSYKYVLKTDGKEHIGLLAQDIQNIIPQAVFINKYDYLTVDYPAITALLCDYVGKLEKRIESLENKVG